MSQQSREVRATILDHATRLFYRDGYVATTLPRIAKHAGVSVDAIYQEFRSKQGLVRAMFELARASATVRSDEIQALTDARAVFRHWSAVAIESSPRVSLLLLMIRDAASADRDMADLLRETEDARLQRMTVNAERLARKFGIPQDHARDVLFVATSPELYEMLVVKRGWTVEAYGELIEKMLAGLLL